MSQARPRGDTRTRQKDPPFVDRRKLRASHFSQDRLTLRGIINRTAPGNGRDETGLRIDPADAVVLRIGDIQIVPGIERES